MVDLATCKPGVTGVVADMRALPFADGSLDSAVANPVLYHVIDPKSRDGGAGPCPRRRRREDRLDAQRRLLRTAPGIGNSCSKRNRNHRHRHSRSTAGTGRHLLCYEPFHHVKQVNTNTTLILSNPEVPLGTLRRMAPRPCVTSPNVSPTSPSGSSSPVVKQPSFKPTRPGR